MLDEHGNHITNEEDAAAVANTIMAPLKARRVADFKKKVAEAAADAEILAKAAEEKAKIREKEEEEARLDKHALKIADAWDFFIDPVNELAPDCSPQNLKNYRAYWFRFVEWMKNQQNIPVYMRDVTEDLAKHFAGHLKKSGCSGNTFNKYRAFLCSFFNALSESIRGGKNPFATVKKKRMS